MEFPDNVLRKLLHVIARQGVGDVGDIASAALVSVPLQQGLVEHPMNCMTHSLGRVSLLSVSRNPNSSLVFRKSGPGAAALKGQITGHQDRDTRVRKTMSCTAQTKTEVFLYLFHNWQQLREQCRKQPPAIQCS